MSKKSLKNILESESKKFYLKNKDRILDVVLFGSLVRGKDKPKDIDILLIFKEKKDLEITHRLRKILEQKIKIDVEVTSINYNKLFDTKLKIRESFLTEGYSLINKRGIAEGLGFANKVLFNYNLKGKSKSQRMRFYYSLYGRTHDQEGMLGMLFAKTFSETLILCPVESANELEEYFGSWNFTI